MGEILYSPGIQAAAIDSGECDNSPAGSDPNVTITGRALPAGLADGACAAGVRRMEFRVVEKSFLLSSPRPTIPLDHALSPASDPGNYALGHHVTHAVPSGEQARLSRHATCPWFVIGGRIGFVGVVHGVLLDFGALCGLAWLSSEAWLPAGSAPSEAVLVACSHVWLPNCSAVALSF
jgi:hypothetical protein